MGTMNFSIPDDVKDKFNEVFEGQNKSAVVTELLRYAINEKKRGQDIGTEANRKKRFEQALARL